MANEVIVYNPYNLNPLMTNVLITNNEVIFHAPTKQTVDPRIIQNSIIIAEQRYIRPALGYALYSFLCDAKNVLVMNVNKADLQSKVSNVITLREGNVVNSAAFLATPYQTLWFKILWKLVAECVLLVSIPDHWAQFGSEGFIHPNPTAPNLTGHQSTTSPDLKSVQFLLDSKMRDRIDPLLVSLQEFLCYNRADYGLYTGCPEVTSTLNNEVTDIGKRTDWITSIYDDIDEPKGCWGKRDFL